MKKTDLPDFDESRRPMWAGPASHKGEKGRWGAGEELVRIHDHLRRESDELTSRIDAFAAGEESPDEARRILSDLSSRVSYSAIGSLCSGFCQLLTMHHTIEDRALFPGLARDEPELLPVLRRLMEEHEVIAEIIGRVYDALDAAERNRGAAGGLKAAAVHLGDRLFSHLHYEESQLVPALNIHGY